jgi:periplasmic protein TonB
MLTVTAALMPVSAHSKMPSTKPRHCSIERDKATIEYPDSLKGSGIHGTVLIETIVGENGCTEGVKVVRKVNPQLDDLAMQAVNSWKFSPATKDGKPVKVMITVPVEFEDVSK